jgi:type III secretion protein Q
MNARTWPFATLTAAEVAQADIAAACARLGVSPQWRETPAEGAMLRFDISGRFGTLQVAVPADAWCPRMLPALAGLAWSELVDRETLSRWLPEGPLLQFHHPALADVQVALRDVVPAGTVCIARGAQPCLDTAQGSAWIQQLHVNPGLHTTEAAAALRLAVDLEVTRVPLSLQRLRTLTPGSVVLLTQFQPIARTATHRLYTFDFTLETVSVNTPFDFPDEDGLAADLLPPPGATPPSVATPAGLDVARLPVTLEVILCQLQHSVGELAALQPGTVFHLPPNAWQQLQLRVNGQTVARGELVQIGDQLGVQLHQAPVLS